MLASPELVKVTAHYLAGISAPIVVDPVCVSKHGDDLLVVTTAKVRAKAERRIRSVSRHGRLAGIARDHRRCPN